VHASWDVKWVAAKALIAFVLLVSVSATPYSHQNADNKTPSNGTIGVDYHAKVFYKHHWPVRKNAHFTVTSITKYFI